MNRIYTDKQIEVIVRQVLQSLDLGNEIQPDVIASKGESSMLSNYNQNEINSKEITLSEFVNTIFRRMFMKKLAPSTVITYDMMLDRYILPAIGSKTLDSITVLDVQNLFDLMATAKSYGYQRDLKSGTIARVSGLLGRLFRIANDLDLTHNNPIKKTLLFNNGEESEHHEALPDSEVLRVKREIPQLKDEQQRLYMGLLVYTGMRREEILGLGWEHLNFEDGYGHVQRTVTFPDNKKAITRDKTKTKHSARDFIIPDKLMEILKPCAKKSGFIIHGEDPNLPIPPKSFQRMYKSVFKTLGISGYNNHDWRATFATQLKEYGLTSAQVADLMGHADTRMVEKVYAPRRHEGIMKHKYSINMINQAV